MSYLGWGYGRRSQTYTLLLSRRRKRSWTLRSSPPITRHPKELLAYELGTESPLLRTVLSDGPTE